MAVVQHVDDLSEKDYLAGERIAEERHEYVDGQVFAMAGSSKRHNAIMLNVVTALRSKARDAGCDVFSADVKVRIEQRKSFYYPDVMVGCDQQDDHDEYYLDHPCLIVEVLSKSTEWKDYNEKLLAYQSIDSLQAYLVVAQDKPYVSLFYRDTNQQWWVKTYEELGQCIDLPCPNMSLLLADIYAAIGF